jgi:small subunit ribosomal protein S6
MTRKHYEMTTIIKPEGGHDAVKQFAERVDGIVNEFGGKILKLQSWGEKKLAYEIKKNMKGHYLFFNLVAEGSLIKELERNFNIWENVLKFMSIRIDKNEDIDKLVEEASGIASLFEKAEKKEVVEEKVEKVEKKEKEEEKNPVEDVKKYNEELQKTLRVQDDKEDEEDVEL